MTSSSDRSSASSEALPTPAASRRGAAIARVQEVARARGAALATLGHVADAELEGNDWRDRGAGAAHRATFPMLVVPAGLTDPPVRVLIATDFSETSLCAARAALDLVPDDAQVFLVHVCDKRWCCQPGEAHGPRHKLDEPFASLFHALQATLHAPYVRFTRVILDGEPAEALLDFARRRSVDLIAIGVHGRASTHEKALGAVAERVLRGAPCSVLVAESPAQLDVGTPRIARRRLAG